MKILPAKEPIQEWSCDIESVPKVVAQIETFNSPHSRKVIKHLDIIIKFVCSAHGGYYTSMVLLDTRLQY